MTDTEPLKRFWEAINYKGKVYGPYRERAWKSFYKDNYQILIQNFEEFQFVMCLIWNWLSKPKQNQFKKTIKAYLSYRD